jgi:hypothetical protein
VSLPNLFLVLSLVTLSVTSVHAQGGSEWDEFLQHPGDKTFAELQARVASSARDCEEDVSATNDQRSKLFGLIRDGNEQAIHAGLLVSHCFDGADAEDFYRSAGVFLEDRPRAFLQIAEDSEVSDRELDRMVTMLPIETVDDFDARLAEVHTRIAKLEAVDDPALVMLKREALGALVKEVKEYQKAKRESQKPRRSSTGSIDQQNPHLTSPVK